MFLSIIVATYNRGKSLKGALESILNQSRPEGSDFEVIVVDNNSTDDTKAIILSLAEKAPRLRYLFEKEKGKCKAVNKGIQEARGDVLVFTDDDVVVGTGWLENLAECFTRQGCDAMGGRVLPVYPDDTPDWVRNNPHKMSGVVVIFDQGEKSSFFNEKMERFIGANCAFRKDIFKECGFFRTDLGPGTKAMAGEDDEYFNRLIEHKKSIYYSAEAVVLHPVDLRRLSLRHIAKWNIGLGCHACRKEKKSGKIQVMPNFGFPRYLIRGVLKDMGWIMVSVFNRLEFFNAWKSLFYQVGKIQEYRRLYKEEASPERMHPLRAAYKAVLPLKWRIAILEFLFELKTIFGLLWAKCILLFSYHGITGLLRSPKTILFWPFYPDRKRYVFDKIRFLMGYRVINHPGGGFHAMMEWEDITIRKRPGQYLNALERLGCINARCLDISKTHVDEIFAQIFGYSIEVDPLTFKGLAVKKSNDNALHDGEIIQCPIEKAEERYVYQRIINNEYDEAHYYDIRVPIFAGEIPFLYYKYRAKNDRFDHFTRADVIKGVDYVFTADEVKKMLQFAQKIGLQYGELDVLRDKDDGMMYIIDTNNTPAGPRAGPMSFGDFVFAVVKLAESFDRNFLKDRTTLREIDSDEKKFFNFREAVHE